MCYVSGSFGNTFCTILRGRHKHSDYGWNVKADTAFAQFGGDCYAWAGSLVGTKNGIFSWYLSSIVDTHNQYIGAKDRDYGFNIKSGSMFAVFSVRSGIWAQVGVFACGLHHVIDESDWSIGANVVTMDGIPNRPPALVHMEAILAKENLLEYLHPHRLIV